MSDEEWLNLKAQRPKVRLCFLLHEYFGLPVPFYLHAGVYTRPDTRKFAAITALLHGSEGFLNAAARGTKRNKGHRRFDERQSLSGILKINDVGKFIGCQEHDAEQR
jgi:hypothetical protein